MFFKTVLLIKGQDMPNQYVTSPTLRINNILATFTFGHTHILYKFSPYIFSCSANLSNMSRARDLFSVLTWFKCTLAF